MRQSNASAPGNANEKILPRGDWILLPLIGLLTMCFILVSGEFIARKSYYTTGNVSQYCLTDDAANGYRGIPNSVCTDKNPDTPLTEFKFNSSGYRGGVEFGPKPTGAYRIVMLGSSTAFGWYVPEERSFGALLPLELTLKSGRKVQLYNQALPGGKKGTPHNTALLFNDVLAADPDMILWVLSAWDVENAVFEENQAPSSLNQRTTKTGLLARIWSRLKKMKTKGSVVDEVTEIWNSHLISALTKHYLYKSQSLYMKSFLMKPDLEYLRTDPSAHWNERLKLLDGVAAEIEGRANAAKVPFVAVYMPYQATATMVSAGEWPVGYDPYKIDGELRNIITSHGGIYIDMLPLFRVLPNPGQMYYTLDGHPNAYGHSIIASLLAKELTSGAVPALKIATQPQAALELGR